MRREVLVAIVAGALGTFFGGLGVFLYFMLLREPTLEKVAQGIGGMATAVGTAGALVIAWLGLQTWLQQLRGTARFDACRRFLGASFRMRDEFASMRAPLRSVLQMPGEDWATASNRDLVQRYNRLAALARRCEVSAYSLEVVVGPQVRTWIRTMRRLVGELHLAVQSTVQPGTSALLDANEAREVLYETTIGKSAEFTATIDRLFRDVEEEVGPLIRGSV